MEATEADSSDISHVNIQLLKTTNPLDVSRTLPLKLYLNTSHADSRDQPCL